MNWSKNLQEEIEDLKKDIKNIEDLLENSKDLDNSLKKKAIKTKRKTQL